MSKEGFSKLKKNIFIYRVPWFFENENFAARANFLELNS